MRTTVYTNPDNSDETDEFPGCHGSVDDSGLLVIADDDSAVEAEYPPGEWASFETVAADDS